MDKELIKQYRLEEAQKRFQQISEYTFITKPLIQEDGEDEQQPQQPPQDGGAPQQQQQGQMPPQQASGNGGGQQPEVPMPQGDMGGQGGDAQGMPPMGDGNMPPQQPEGQGMDVPPTEMSPEGEGEPMQDGDEVIDVDELTNAQEASEAKIDGVNDKLQNLLAVTTKFIAAVDQNNKKIDDLRAEFEKRNPTEEERINIRSQASAPYFETPKDYWDKKKQDSNYNVIYNNDVDPDKEDKEFTITRNDLDNIDDRSLSKSLDYPTKLKDFINF